MLQVQAQVQVLEQCGMDYAVEKVPAYARGKDDASGQPTFEIVPNQFHLSRSSDGRVVSPKTVSARYSQVGPREMMVPITPLLEEKRVSFKEGKILQRGSHEMLSFRIDNALLVNGGRVAGEEWDHFFQLHNFHALGAFFGRLYCTRKICKNGMTGVVQKGAWKLRHTGEIEANYADAMRTWEEIKEEIQKLSDQMTLWAGTKISLTQVSNLFREIYELDEGEEPSPRLENELNFAVAEFHNPERGTYGNSLADVYNAITATNSHYKPSKSKESEEKFWSSMLNPQGSRNKLEARAVEVISSFLT